MPRSGSYFTRELKFLNTSIIIVRGKDDVIRAFHNVCPHRGNKMLWSDDPFEEVQGRAPRRGCSAAAAQAGAVGSSGDMRAICAPIDFLGLNYYSPHYVRLGDWDDLRQGESALAGHPGVVNYLPPEIPRTVMGWLVEPDGLYDTLRGLDVESPGLPIYITENGCGCDDYVTPEGEVNDLERVDYLRGHLDAAWRAIQDGVNLSGYFHWSLMDNFEWARGYSRRFGLYFVDFGTQRRLPKRSAAVYSRVARTNSLPLDGDSLVELSLAHASSG